MKSWYKKSTIGYIILLILYLTLAIVTTMYYFDSIDSNTKLVITFSLYFLAAGAYAILLFGHVAHKADSYSLLSSVSDDE